MAKKVSENSVKKDKPKKEKVVKTNEKINQEPISQNESTFLIKEDGVTKEIKVKAPEEEFEAPKELTFQAKKWSDYLDYLRFEPTEFLLKYPNHKFKEFIEEIVEFRKKQGAV